MKTDDGSRDAVILVAERDYTHGDEEFLRQLIDRGVDLFCAVGAYAEAWEEAMDWLCVELDTTGAVPGAFVTTTSHSEEEMAEARLLAENWGTGEGSETNVQVVHL